MVRIGEVEMANAMRPECVYRNGICPEIKPCGWYKDMVLK
jgi:hypothetical protein